MKRIFYISVSLLLCLFSALSYGKKPNVLLIMADDLGFETVQSYGGRSYKTPNMTRLAKEGVQFNQAYATPLCSPTRVQLMTGKYNFRTWLGFGLFDPTEKTFGHYMQEAGYNTAIAGKWQLQSYDPVGFPGAGSRRGKGMKVENAGFDEYSLWHTAHTEDKGSRYPDPLINQNGQFLKQTAGKYGPDIWLEFLSDFMTRKKDDEKPFFAYYAMSLPHSPFNPTPDSEEWSERSKHFDESDKYFADMVEYADKVLGKLIDKVNQLGIREETIIIFYSDNGTQWNILSDLNGQIVQGGKALMTDLGTRVPMYVSWKGKTPEGQINNDLIESTDFLPTLLDIAGEPEVAKQQKMDGMSFLPQIKGEKGVPRDWVYVHHDPRPGKAKDRFYLQRFARDKDYKLYQDGRMYQPAKDLYEERVIMPEDDTRKTKKVRKALQFVLDSMKTYEIYDPKTMPREAKRFEFLKHYMFEDFTGCVVMEAESVGFDLDESWIIQNLIPGFTGAGYLRSLREQTDKPEKGIISFNMNISSAGQWFVDVRHRHDNADLNKQNSFWMKIGSGPWEIYSSANNTKSTGWEFAISQDQSTIISTQFVAGANRVQIAPLSDNFKLDRVVAYRENRENCAKDIATPQVGFHPWFDAAHFSE
ncbi:sulfatase-like hydrolase/transferase [Paraglaciecola sp. L3A3]|uniref:sulfatase-like hydrolase/transferase n=1 Tax=Paraglaciecola sp. L3A3 TaxID=2686358 RepID=UPI00131E4DC9|nr:sulfatase-like hydrolase/transferase [Paraglaciecola sp. L3A3]